MIVQYTFKTLGPHKTWEYLRKTTGSIPTQRKVKDHVEDQFNHCLRGKEHTNPQKEMDVAALQASYSQCKIHIYDSKRQLAKVDMVEDYTARGSDPIALTKVMKNWSAKRVSTKADTEDWEYEYEIPVRVQEAVDAHEDRGEFAL